MTTISSLTAQPPVSHLSAKKNEAENEQAPPQEDGKAQEDTFIQISYLPQDPGMMGVKHAKIDGTGITDGPSGPRFRVSEPNNFPVARASEKGNFLYRTDDPRFDAANTYYIAHRTLEMSERYASRTIPWSFSQELGRDQMLIHPHAGEMANAFYSSDAGSINFFHFKAEDGTMHRTAQQTDVVAHETGHAILDAMRPLYINSLAVAAGGYHEAFGDMLAMLNSLHDESVIAALKQETSGDLSGSNVASRIAENLGQVAYGTPALRDMVNEHKYADQHFLPYIDRENPNGGLGTEAHAYANLFTGAFYDIFRDIYDVVSSDPDRSFTDAVTGARDLAGQLLFRGTEFSPVGSPSYREVALAFLQADQIDNEGALRPILEKAFVGRDILTEEDLAEFDAQQAALPKLSFRESLMEEKGAERFLQANREKLGVPEDMELSFYKAFTNELGEKFIQFEAKRDEVLDGSEFSIHEGSKVRGVGGLQLAFNADGDLIASNLDAITEREMTDIKNHLRTAIALGRLADGGESNQADAHSYLHVDVVRDGGGRVLQKSGVVYC